MFNYDVIFYFLFFVASTFRQVIESEGLHQTATESIRNMRESGDKEKLAYIAEKVISRMN